MTVVLSRKTEFDGYHKLETVVVQPRSLRGEGLAEPLSREVFHAGKAAQVLLYCPETDSFIISEQFRMGAFLAGVENPFLLECAGGVIGTDETPEQAARREVLEETGCDVSDIEFIGSFYPSAGCLAEEFFLFCARVPKDSAAGIFGREEEGEEIRTRLVPADDLKRMLFEEKSIPHMSTATALFWFFAHRDWLRQKWAG